MAGAIVWVDERGFKDSKVYTDAEALEVAWGTVLETTERMSHDEGTSQRED